MKSQSRNYKQSILIGDFLKQQRQIKGITQKKVALHLGVHPMFISHIENNKAPLPYHHLAKISEIYGVSKKALTAQILDGHKILIKRFL